MIKINSRSTAILLVLLLTVTGCKKFLDKKSSQKLVIPSSLADLQSLLDDYEFINLFDPFSGERACDNYYVTDNDWANLGAYGQPEDHPAYIWDTHYIFPKGDNDWSYGYNNVYRANVVLSSIDNIPVGPQETAAYNQLKGEALFIRGRVFLQSALLWAKAWDEQQASEDKGIPLRLDPEFNTPSTRSTVRQTYEQVLSDLKAAAGLLPIEAIHCIKPSRPAAYGLVARTYLSMRQYDSAARYANLCLELKNELLDYNPPVNPAADFPVERFNKEVLYDGYMKASVILDMSIARVDSILYRSFADNDLRKAAFFRDNGDGSHTFKGNYSGTNSGFTGVAVDEVYLMRAECHARKGDAQKAMDDLNTLLIKRWKTGTFVPLVAADAAEALQMVLQERRKELIMRGLRWMDLKRLNKEGYQITPRRMIGGKIYELPPNDDRYALPIPEEVIALTGMPQN